MALKWKNRDGWAGLFFTMGPLIFIYLIFILNPKYDPKFNFDMLLQFFIYFTGAGVIIGIPFLILLRKFEFGKAIGISWLILLIAIIFGGIASKIIESIHINILSLIFSLLFAAFPSIIALVWIRDSPTSQERQAKLDPNVDKESVERKWGSRSDESLIEAAAEPSEYTLEAEEIIHAELARRGLSVPTVPPSNGPLESPPAPMPTILPMTASGEPAPMEQNLIIEKSKKRMGGWWRLWILLSLIWGVGIVSFGVMRWPGNGERHKLSDDEISLLTPQTKNLFTKPPPVPGEGQWVTVEEQPYFDVKKSNQDLDRIIRGLRPLPDPPRKKIREFWPTQPKWEEVTMRSGQKFLFWFRSDIDDFARNQMCNAARMDYERVQDQILNKWRWKLVRSYFSIWLGSCLSILMLALGLRWVVSGFKKESANTANRQSR